jgi:hypothetical protein
VAGETLTADKLNSRHPVTVLKTASQSVGSETMTDDDHLKLPVGADQQWLIRLMVAASGHLNGDIKTNWSIPPGASGRKFVLGPQLDMASGGRLNTSVRLNVLNWDTENRYGTETNGTAIVIREEGVLETGSEAGEAIFRWAQNTAHSTATSVLSGSYISAQRIG